MSTLGAGYSLKTGVQPETQTYVSRVDADGGTVHDVQWVDTVISTLKDLGVYGDVVFLGDANMGTDVASTGNGVGTLYDASGNQNDASQSDSAKKPILDTDSGFNGCRVIDLDGTDDWLDPKNAPTLGQPFSLIAAKERREDKSRIIAGETGGAALIGDGGNNQVYAGTRLIGSSDRGPLVHAGLFDGTESETRENGTVEAVGDAGSDGIPELAIAKFNNTEGFFDGLAGTLLAVNVGMTDTEFTGVEVMLNDYYSIY